MGRYAAWVFDIDGTLLDSQAVLRPRTVAALEALRATGVPLLLATALPRRYALMKLPGAAYLGDTGVFLGGGHLLDIASGYVCEVSLEPAVGGQVLLALEAVAPQLQILVQYGDTHHALRHPLPADLLESWGYDERALVPYEPRNGRPFTKVVAWHDDLDLHGAHSTLQAEYGDRAQFYLTDGGHALQVTACEATKGQGLRRLLAHLNVDPVEVIAFGDGAPDAEMLALVGTGVAMANAVPETRAAAVRLAPSNDEDGVAVVIEEYLAKPHRK